MIGDCAYVILVQTDEGVWWNLRSGRPDSASVELARGTAFTWEAATHESGRALAEWAKKHWND